MIIDELIQIKIGPKNYEHFKNLNYDVKSGKIIYVKHTDLMPNNKNIITAKCDICGNVTKIEYRSYLKNIKKYPVYCCNTSCAKIKEKQTKNEMYGEDYENMRVSKMKETNKKRYGNENTSQIFRNEKNQNVFIEQLREIYKNEAFDYSKINYINNYTPIEIICSKHGKFKIRPIELLIGQGCKECNKEKSRGIKLEKYLQKAKNIHNNKFDYSKILFKNLSEKVIIVCPIHGEFKQSLINHLSGKGCKECGKITLRLKFLDRINKNLENGYQITPSFNKKACEIFDEISKKENIHIQHAMNGGEYYISSLGYWLDGYDEINNVAYEFDEKKHFINGKLSSKDKNRQKEIKKLLKCKFIRIKDL
jgi:hypothetical protein